MADGDDEPERMSIEEFRAAYGPLESDAYTPEQIAECNAFYTEEAAQLDAELDAAADWQVDEDVLSFDAKDAFDAERARTHDSSAAHDYACEFQAAAEAANELEAE